MCFLQVHTQDSAYGTVKMGLLTSSINVTDITLHRYAQRFGFQVTAYNTENFSGTEA